MVTIIRDLAPRREPPGTTVDLATGAAGPGQRPYGIRRTARTLSQLADLGRAYRECGTWNETKRRPAATGRREAPTRAREMEVVEA